MTVRSVNPRTARREQAAGLLRDFRVRWRLTQGDAAFLLGLPNPYRTGWVTVCRWERVDGGGNGMAIPSLLALALETLDGRLARNLPYWRKRLVAARGGVSVRDLEAQDRARAERVRAAAEAALARYRETGLALGDSLELPDPLQVGDA